MSIAAAELRAFVQTQDRSGNWITIRTTINRPAFIVTSMREVKALIKDQRVRAVDGKDRILDIL